MNFTLLSPLGFAAGLFALAGGLYLLQRLRVRHRELNVVTTLFWHEAVHETRARVLVQRFRHPWAYALILAIAALLWAAVGAPERAVLAEQRYVFLLDASAAMAHVERFEEAKSKLLDMIDEAPREAREVLVCGATVETLLLPGEEALLLKARLEGLAPVAAPGSLDRALDALARRTPVPTSVLVFGDTIVDEARLALLPAHINVGTVFTRSGESMPSQNSGITALGASPAESGAWGAVDLLIEVTSNQGEVAAPSLKLAGQPFGQAVTRRALADGVTHYILRDVPARGGRFEARLGGGDSLALDDVASLILPNWPLLRVQVSAALDDRVRAALDADPAVVIVTQDADVVVRRAGENLGTGLPALVFAPAIQQEESFLVQYTDEREAESVLAEVAQDLALREIDATSLADAAQQPITIGAKRGTEREVAVWEELLGEGFDFVDSRGFPLFIGGSLRWLARSEPLQPWVAAGESPIATAALTNSEGFTLRPLGVPAVPTVAGDYTTADGARVAVSLLSPAMTLAQFYGGYLAPLSDAAGGALDPVTWLLLLAALLLLVEWRQVRKGKMP